ncbi:hypothetical protein AAG570_010493 [Ranatra chinensis]|uniref:Protogenin n=1 Tax=Ranatra chinensis TaxID=642074 RepID=A0ABD0Z4T5_9HEMI
MASKRRNMFQKNKTQETTENGMSHEFSLSPENETILEGDAVRLTCTIDSVPPASIVWQRDFRPLPHNKRYVTTDSGVLYIINARKDDSGRYRCQATNSLIKKVRQSEDGLLTVIPGAGKFAGIEFLPDSPPSSATIRKGRNGSLVCAAKGHPRPSLAWTFTKMDGTNLTFQSTSNGLNILKIANMTRDNAGKYTCTAIQTIKESVTSSRKTVNLEFYVPPTIVRKPKSDEHPAAKTVRIDCEVQAVPMKNVTWLKDANKLHIDGRIRQKTKELILGDLVSQDTGIYQCIVGDQWGAGRLVVQTSINQPPPPTNVTCSSISATEVRISWFPPKVDDPSTMLLPYTVHHFPTDGGEEGKQISQNLTYIVNQLAPYTNYTFYVRAYNQYAASEQSMRATCSTFEAVPIGGPRVTVHAPASHCLTISWVPPPISLARGTITQYKVQWKCTNQNFTYFEILPGYIRRYSVTEPATWYEVSISSFTSQSEGKICTENILTHEPFEIAKLPPPYNVEARNTTSARIIGLNAKTAYEVTIMAHGVNNDISIASSKLECRTLPEVTPAVENIQWQQIGGDCVKITGILVGCGISACCIALCTGTLLYKRKCIKYTRNSATNSSNTQHPPCSAQHEMQSLTPFDTKYEVYKGHEGEGSRTTDEGDSLLSGPELEIEGEDTQLTVIESTVIKDTVPDDGFHETNHNILLAPNG